MAAHGYDLYAVSHHFGNMVGGHYTATCMVPPLQPTSPQQQPPHTNGGGHITGNGVPSSSTSAGVFTSTTGGGGAAAAAAAAAAGGTTSTAAGGTTIATTQWWTFNDEHVSRIAPHSVVSNTAYMLFYVRRDYLHAAGAQLEGARAAVAT